jgi:predicted secreted protein
MTVPSQIHLAVHQSYVFTLAGRGSAGYRWSYSVEGNSSVVRVSMATAPMPPGQAGAAPPQSYNLDQQVTIEALAPGQVAVHFEQRRPWEQATPPLAAYTVEVSVT